MRFKQKSTMSWHEQLVCIWSSVFLKCFQDSRLILFPKDCNANISTACELKREAKRLKVACIRNPCLMEPKAAADGRHYSAPSKWFPPICSAPLGVSAAQWFVLLLLSQRIPGFFWRSENKNPVRCTVKDCLPRWDAKVRSYPPFGYK